MASGRVLVHTCGLMEQSIVGSGNRACAMARENIRLHMAVSLWAILSMIMQLEATCCMLMEITSMVMSSRTRVYSNITEKARVFANKDEYEGDWERNKMHDHGIYIFANGNILEGVWLEGTFTLAKGHIYL